MAESVYNRRSHVVERNSPRKPGEPLPLADWPNRTNGQNAPKSQTDNMANKKAVLPASLSGKTVVITGANSGIGKITAKTFARLGAKVYMLCRDVQKARTALDEIVEELKNPNIDVSIEQMDLQSLQSVRMCAARLNEKISSIDYLINNAGIMMCKGKKTVDGFESQFGTNHLGHFLLTNLLMEKIKASPTARIVNLASVAYIPGMIHFDNINLVGNYTPGRAYYQSKLANVLFTMELARRLHGTNIKSYAVHPGLVATELGRYLESWAQCLLNTFHRLILITPEAGAQTTLHCAFSDQIAQDSGKYFANCKMENLLPHARDEEDAQRLWDLSLALCKTDNNNFEVKSEKSK